MVKIDIFMALFFFLYICSLYKIGGTKICQNDTIFRTQPGRVIIVILCPSGQLTRRIAQNRGRRTSQLACFFRAKGLSDRSLFDRSHYM